MSSLTETVVDFVLIAGYGGYCVGSDGSVWSRWMPQGVVGDEWNKLTPALIEGGYLIVSLRSQRMTYVQRYVHRLVLEAFRGPCPAGMQTRHLNGLKSDNRLDNLAWGTPKQNAADRIVHGTVCQGERHGRALVTENDIREIRARAASGERQKAMAREYGVCEGSISMIVNRLTWKHVS